MSRALSLFNRRSAPPGPLEASAASDRPGSEHPHPRRGGRGPRECDSPERSPRPRRTPGADPPGGSGWRGGEARTRCRPAWWTGRCPRCRRRPAAARRRRRGPRRGSSQPGIAASASSHSRSFSERSTRYWIVSWSTAMPSLKANVCASAAIAGSSSVRGGVNVFSPMPAASSSGVASVEDRGAEAGSSTSR